MCGIFGLISKKNVLKSCINGLKLLEYRGYDSFGIAGLTKDNMFLYKKPGKISLLEENLKNIKVHLSLAIGHTRWATHGKPTKLNAHPHMDHKSSIALVHNGIIENFDEIKKMLISKNIHFQTDTDTEVIVQLITYYYKNDLIKATKKALNKLIGSYAIALIHKDYPNQIIASSKESPLAIAIDEKKDEMLISSDPNAFLGKDLNITFLSNNEIALITNKKINIYSNTLNLLNKKYERFNSKKISANKNGYEHYMLKEIYEQPITIQKAYFGRILDFNKKVEFEDFNLSKNYLQNLNHIFILACGTSYHAALYAKYLIEDLAKTHVFAEIASEMRMKELLITNKDLAIAISQSGETADTLLATKLIKNYDSNILAIINKTNSTLSREATSYIFVKAGPEFSVCSTKAFTSQITVMYLFAIYLASIKKIDKLNTSLLLKELKKIPSKIKKVLKLAPQIKILAKKYSKYEKFFFLGRNYMYVAALEAALKLKEISYINANAYPAGELKHGPLALACEDHPVIAFLSNEKTYDKMLSNLMEIKARNAPILAIASKKSKAIEDIADDVIYLPKTIDELSILPSSVASQLLAYYIAKERKTDIDQPRNLAKSVTVE
ncbi:MAG: Glutamine--fructose-6-phosphate aminotransferase [isomerizing] [Candidatus Anoxychlamydiales bacterium]|nr:Glutamine--fructose-6-phosphate aminotransferase [isomerizing] [Candidatus Anoxychlamydiales bacterium]